MSSSSDARLTVLGGRLSYAEYLRTPAWQDVRRAALWAAGGRCRTCGSTRELVIHHRDYSSVGEETPDDVTVLCARCHGAITRALGQGGHDVG